MVPAPPKCDLAVPVTDRDHGQGSVNAPVTIVEYGDYECPYCAKAYPIIKQIQRNLGDQLRFVFRNFPQNTVHEHAAVAAQAAEAAAAQGKFWEMHDLLYEHKDDLADFDPVQFALKLGLEVYKFQADLATERYARRVREDFEGGLQSHIKCTPTLFINGSRYIGEFEYGSLLRAVERASREESP